MMESRTRHKERQVVFFCNKELGFDPTVELSANYWQITNNICDVILE